MSDVCEIVFDARSEFLVLLPDKLTGGSILDFGRVRDESLSFG